MKLARRLFSGDRRALSKAITLIESTHPSHQADAGRLLDGVLAERRENPGRTDSFRIGLAGPPGSGKSSLIESLGVMLSESGRNVAVLAIDPSSVHTGGSILGDRTRMPELSRRPNVFVRPSPSGGVLGGVAQHTADISLLCEAAGFDIVLVETVGLGQSEVVIDSVVDLVTLVLPPTAGDSLQGIKKGVMEIADLVLVNKADGALADAAKRTASDYRQSLQLQRPRYLGWRPRVELVSAHTKYHLHEAWELMCDFQRNMLLSGELRAKRERQFEQSMDKNADLLLHNLLHASPVTRRRKRQLRASLHGSRISARRAAQELVEAFLHHKIDEVAAAAAMMDPVAAADMSPATEW